MKLSEARKIVGTELHEGWRYELGFEPGFAPNLDDTMDPDDLMAFAQEAHAQSARLAREMFPDHPQADAQRALKKLEGYARLKSVAMNARMSGDVAFAMQQERLADRQYQQLPDWARW